MGASMLYYTKDRYKYDAKSCLYFARGFINRNFKLSYVADQLSLSQTWWETFLEMRLLTVGSYPSTNLPIINCLMTWDLPAQESPVTMTLTSVAMMENIDLTSQSNLYSEIEKINIHYSEYFSVP